MTCTTIEISEPTTLHASIIDSGCAATADGGCFVDALPSKEVAVGCFTEVRPPIYLYSDYTIVPTDTAKWDDFVPDTKNAHRYPFGPDHA